MDHIYIACLRLYFLYYLDSYRYAPKLRGVSSAIAEAAEMADGAELDEEEWPEAVPDLEEEWPEVVPDLEEEWTSDAVADLEEEEWPDTLPDLEEEWPDTLPDLVDLQERESADSVADFDEESADAVSVAFER